MMSFEQLLQKLGKPFGILAESNTHQLTVIARNLDVAVGDLFLLPSLRGIRERLYIFRTNQYANILNRALEINDIAQNKLTMPDSYLSEDLIEEQLIELKGVILGYAEYGQNEWIFHKPRRLPEHLSEVFRVDPENEEIATVINLILKSQCGEEGLFLGHLLVGEQALKGVKVFLPNFALSHHLGVFGKTGAGKSNLMMILLKSVLEHNRHLTQLSRQTQKSSIFAIDPHDEFRTWHSHDNRPSGISAIVTALKKQELKDLVEPFYYLTAKTIHNQPYERTLCFSRADIVPEDLFSISEFSEQQVAFSQEQYSQWGEIWIPKVLMGDTQAPGVSFGQSDYLPGTISAVQRRLGFLRQGRTKIITPFDPDIGYEYESLLPDIICALESGRVLIVDTTLINEMEQFLLTTIVARTLFTLRKALKSVSRSADLGTAIYQAFGHDENLDQRGLKTMAFQLLQKIESGELPYLSNEKLASITELPHVNVVVEEAPSVLNPQRMKFGSVFRDISRQGRKFGIGLTVVSQQVSEIDKGILTQINTELIMSLGNEEERRKAIANASCDLAGFEKELQVMGKGQVIITSSYHDIPLPIQVPSYDGVT